MSTSRGRDGATATPSVRPGARPFDALRDACVVIIDDLDANVRLLERILGAAGVAQAHGITDARLAVERCVELRPDLVLLDLHMPHLDGHEVLRELRATMPTDELLPIVMLTADTEPAVREQALDAGANDFLTKPFDRVEVVQRARNLVAMRAMYAEVQQHNAQLREELEAQALEQAKQAAVARAREERVRTALAPGSLHMEFQPIVDLNSGDIVGAEALARFTCEPRQRPDEWFAEAAAAGLGVELEIAAISLALARLDDLAPDVTLSVNASPSTVLSDRLRDVLATPAASRVVVELTEHARVDDYDAVRTATEALRASGVRLAVDDAGAGYAGLQQILQLCPDIIKLDLAITRGIDDDPVRRALAASLHSFADETGAQIVAEGIETAGELEQLRRLGMRWGQGFLLARPGPLPLPTSIDVTSAAS